MELILILQIINLSVMIMATIIGMTIASKQDR